MKQTLILLALASASAGVFAQVPQVVQPDAAYPLGRPSPETQDSALDPWHFCYFAGQPYSEGAKVGGNVCAEKHAIRMIDDSGDGKKDPLVWLTPSDFKNRM